MKVIKVKKKSIMAENALSYNKKKHKNAKWYLHKHGGLL